MAKAKENIFSFSPESGPYQIYSLHKGKANCEHCGHVIKNIFTIKDNQNQLYQVGSKCVEKIDSSLVLVAEQKLKILKSSLIKEAKVLKYKETIHQKAMAFKARLVPQTITGKFLLQITDPEMVGLDKILLDNDCSSTSDSMIFEAHTLENQEMLISSFDSLDKLESNTELIELVNFVNDYQGNFDFILSLKAQLAIKGFLSEGQLQAIKKVKDKDFQIKETPTIVLTNSYIRVSKFIANELAKKAGLSSAHFMFKVMENIRETDKAYYLKLQASGRPTTHCSCCGLKLTNKISITMGIGPICAEKMSVSNSIELDEKLTKTAIFEAWVPKRSIKEKVNF